MSKKSKRQVRKTIINGTAESARASVPRTPFASSGMRVYEKEFNPDYTTVINDLKRVGILAGSFIVILVILSFFLR